jgi:chromosome segregation ATPase
MYYQQNTSYPYNYYLEPAYAPSKDNAITPLSYVKATDPAYASLQSQYQALSQQLNQAQSENQKLQQDLKAQQDQNAQLKAQAQNNANLTQQLASSQSLVLTLEGGILALVGLVGVLGFLLYRKIFQRTAIAPTMNQSLPENVRNLNNQEEPEFRS